ncbi:dolichyl-phosphate-mannose--protein mannosyltransferase [Kitasatospora sp. NPDC052896]|uniref:dolichyl-phosphate-mannose--protein mannosyltransferase n=1 Tax=Kitasatospora sp. NPDC052896 TaxID=3364061 RepID=UPI0037C7B04D
MLVPPPHPARLRRTPLLARAVDSGWAAALAVTALAGLLRFWRLGHPRAVLFDETYYAKDAWSLLTYGYEGSWPDDADARLLDRPPHLGLTAAPEFVAHPPVGKWLIALGEAAFGPTPLGWRFVPALLGTLSVLLLCRIGRRLLGSTALGCLAGLLLCLDGLHFVLSRTALLDIALMFWVLAAFGCLLLDRDALRARLAAGVDGGPRWWRLAAGTCLGLACGTKWSAGYSLVAFLLLTLAWEVGAQQPCGSGLSAIRRAAPGALAALLPAAALTYLASWSGWLATSGGWDRDWAARQGRVGPPLGWIPAALRGLFHYHQEIWEFSVQLTTPHRYQSEPADWLLLTRPVSYFYRLTGQGVGGCRADQCTREVLALGTPLLWWVGLVALGCLAHRVLWRRDGRAAAVLCAVAAGYLPWFLYRGRTVFSFYSVAFAPFLCLAVAMLVQAPAGPGGRRWVRPVVAVLLLAGVAANFVWFLPLYTGRPLPTVAWQHRIWFDSWD